MADPIKKTIGGPGQGEKNTLESELAEKAAKIKTIEDMVEKGCKHGFLVLVLGKKSMAQ